jgi:XisI protein
MEKIAKYREYVQKVIESHVHEQNDGVECQIIFDTIRDRYQLVYVGWLDNSRRVYGCVIHMEIKNEKIWIQQDGTEIGTANELVELGVPRQDIVLAFYAPSRRQHTEFAVS